MGIVLIDAQGITAIRARLGWAHMMANARGYSPRQCQEYLAE